MNPLAIIAIIVALVVGYFSFSGSEPGIFGTGRGPIATGPGRSSEVRNPQPISRSVGPPGQNPQPSAGSVAGRPSTRTGDSPYRGIIRIASVQRSGDRSSDEYVIIRSLGLFLGSSANPAGSALPVDITGWRIASLRGSEPIPSAFNIPEIDATPQNVLLSPGGELVVLIGTPTYQKNFRENRCVGYFNQSHEFTPSLADACPDSSPDRSELLRRGFNGACIDAIAAVPTCRTPRGPFQAAIVRSECIDYMNQNSSYVGCVKNFRDRQDFLKSTWRVSLQRPQKLFDAWHDRVTLRDQNGLLVDEFEY